MSEPEAGEVDPAYRGSRGRAKVDPLLRPPGKPGGRSNVTPLPLPHSCRHPEGGCNPSFEGIAGAFGITLAGWA